MKTIPLTKGKIAIVDDEDYEYLNQWKWHVNKAYAARSSKKHDGEPRRKILMHREIYKTYEIIDHINGNGFDNRKQNLREANKSTNAFNSKKKKSFSLYKGVDYMISKNKWRARIKKNYKEIHLGLFEKEIDAAKAYNDAAIKYFSEYARLNKI